jgi:hypothetical protein
MDGVGRPLPSALLPTYRAWETLRLEGFAKRRMRVGDCVLLLLLPQLTV